MSILSFLGNINSMSFTNKTYFFLRCIMLPLYDIDRALPSSGIIVDIGCGIGSLSIFLAASSKKRSVIGWDIDKMRVEAAKKNTQKMLNIKFETKNALDISIVKGISGIVASDVFHHINFVHQEELIKKISKTLNKTGVLVVKEVDKDQKIRALFSLLWDRVFYPNDISYFRTKDDWIALFKKNGFFVDTKKTMPWFPGSQTLFLCRKVV